MTQAIPTPTQVDKHQVERLQLRGTDILADAKGWVIRSPEQYEGGAELLRDIKTMRKAVKELCQPAVKAAHAAHVAAKNIENELDKPLVEAETFIKQRMSEYATQAERDRRIEEARKAKLQKDADDQLRLAEAELLEESGDMRGAQELIDAPAEPSAPPIAQRAVPTTAGVAMRDVWTAEVVDKLALVKAVAEGKHPLAAVEPNMVFLNQQAKSLKREFRFEGVEVVCKKEVAGRAR